VSIIKRANGTNTTLATVAMAIPTGTYYRMRFRVTGLFPVTLQGNVWLDGTLENTINSTTGAWNNSLWTVTAIDY
jgi:hypothetical protein